MPEPWPSPTDRRWNLVTRSSRLRGSLCTLAFAATCHWTAARAHDLITAEAAERYLSQANEHLATIRSREPAPRRAEAHAGLARLQDEIRDLLNRDIAMHGKVQGLPSNLVIERLRAAGAPLNWADRLGRYAAPVEHYRTALDLDRKGRRSGEAMYGLLYGTFYDSFRDDPLQSIASEPSTSRVLVELGESFVADHPRDADIEEARFIVAIAHVRLARAGPAVSRQTARARDLLVRFLRDYPDSLRAAAVPVLLEALPR